MKKFSINPIERFIIRNLSILRPVVFILGLIIIFVFNIFFNNPPEFVKSAILAVVIILFMCFTDFCGTAKLMEIENLYYNQLDLGGTLEASDKMLSVLKPKQLDYIGQITLFKANALYDKGEKEEAKRILYDYLGSCKPSKHLYHKMVECHEILAIINASEHDFSEFERQKELTVKLTEKCYPYYRFLLKKMNLPGLLDLCYRIYSAEIYDETTETEILARLEFRNGKSIPAKKRTPMLICSTYNLLCDYFKTLSDSEKLHYYYRKILRAANSQFAVWHDAKEFLDNEDRLD